MYADNADWRKGARRKLSKPTGGTGSVVVSNNVFILLLNDWATSWTYVNGHNRAHAAHMDMEGDKERRQLP